PRAGARAGSGVDSATWRSARVVGELAICAENAIARIAQAGADVAGVVELAIDRRGGDVHVGVRFAQRLDALGRGDEADEVDALRTRALAPRDRLRAAAAGREHRVDDEHLGVLDAGRDVLVVADGA